MIAIKRWRLDSPYLLAPMAGYTDAIFRQLCRQHGAGAGVTELISAKAMTMGNRRTLKLFDFYPGEEPRWAQIFAGERDTLVTGARLAVEQGAQIVDLNMGCPVRKVVGIGAGAAWLKRPVEAAEAAAAVVRAVPADIPVTVKVRAGWDASQIVAPALVASLAESGVALITVHGRTRSQMYTGRADWAVIAACVEAAAGRVPILGNGDIATHADAQRLMEGLGCTGVMIGRAAMGNPWIFESLADEAAMPPTPGERCAMALEHLRRLISHLGDELQAVQRFRTLSIGYYRGFPGAAEIRAKVSHAQSAKEVEEILAGLKADS